MLQVGVWEQGEGLAERVCALAAGCPVLVRACSHPALLAGQPLELLIVSPGAVGWAGASSLLCRRALLPGGISPLTRALSAAVVLNYGTDRRSAITLSGVNEGKAAVAVQREFCDLAGRAVERQELVLPYDEALPADLFLALTGAALLLGRLG